MFRFVSCSLIALLNAAIAHGQAFRGLGFVNPNNPINNSRAFGISGNGKVVVGSSFGEAFRWTAADGMQSLGISGQSEAYGASYDGSVIVGAPLIFSVGSGIAWRWTLGTKTAVPLYGLQGKAGWSHATAVSDDGNVVVGTSSSNEPSDDIARAVRWIIGSHGSATVQNLGRLTQSSIAKGSEAWAVSGDGNIVVGRSGVADTSGPMFAFRWTAQDGIVSIGDIKKPEEVPWSAANGISKNGNVIVGGTRDPQGFRWESGAMKFLGMPVNPYPNHLSIAMDTNQDGSVVVGTADDAIETLVLTPYGPQVTRPGAFIWNKNDGKIRRVADVLAALGLDSVMGCWNLVMASAISDDGNVIAGYGLHTVEVQEGPASPPSFITRMEAWVAALSGKPFQTEPCNLPSGGKPPSNLRFPPPNLVLYPWPLPPGPPPVMVDGFPYLAEAARADLSGNALPERWEQRSQGLPGATGGDTGFRLTYHPASPTTLFAGTEQGLFVSRTAGERWTRLGDLRHVRSVAIDPRDRSTIYAGANNDGVYASHDAGATWVNSTRSVVGLAGEEVIAIVGAPPHSQIRTAAGPPTPISGPVYAATKLAIFRSSDSGASWTRLAEFPGRELKTLVMAPSDSMRLYLGHDWGVRQSNDGGVTWQNASGGLPYWAPVTALAVHPNDADLVYAAVTGLDGSQLYQSTAGGQNWSLSSTGLPFSGTGTYDSTAGVTGAAISAIVPHPIHPTALYVATVGVRGAGVFTTTSGGSMWRNSSGGLENTFSIVDISADPANGLFYVLSSSGEVMRGELTRAGMSVLHYVTLPPAGTEITDLAMTGPESAMVYAATPAGGFYSTDGGRNWEQPAILAGKRISAIAARGLLAYAAAAPLGSDRYVIYRSLDCGRTWAQVTVVDGVQTIVIDPVDENIAYIGARAGQSAVLKTTDGGTTWRRIGAGIGAQFVRRIAVNPFRPAILYAGTIAPGPPVNAQSRAPAGPPSRVLYRSTDAGASWSAIGRGLPSGETVALTISPADGFIYIAIKGAGLFRSADEGLNFDRVDIPVAEVRDVAVHPLTGSYLVASTEIGLVESPDGGYSWRHFGEERAPTTRILLALHPMRVYAGTFRGGVVRGHIATTEMRIRTPRIVAAQELSRGAGAEVNYSVNVLDLFDRSPEVTVVPPSGTRFPAGENRVQVFVKDVLGFHSATSFLVIVEQAP